MLAEDQATILGALAALLEMENDIEVVARAANGRQALKAVAKEMPDVLVTDIEMPEMSGLTLAAEVHETYPRNESSHTHNLCACRISSPRDGCGCSWLSAEGPPCRRAF